MWMPTKPVNEYSDNEIRETGPYIRMREQTTYTLDGETCYLPDFGKNEDGEENGLIPLTRDVIAECWAVLQDLEIG